MFVTCASILQLSFSHTRVTGGDACIFKLQQSSEPETKKPKKDTTAQPQDEQGQEDHVDVLCDIHRTGAKPAGSTEVSSRRVHVASLDAG